MLRIQSLVGLFALLLAASARAQLTEQYHATFPGASSSCGARSATGALYLAGGQYSGGPSGFDPSLFRVEPDGTLAWSRLWSVAGDGGVAAAAVGVEPAGQFVWVATSTDAPNGVRMLCWDVAGNFQWASARFASNTESTIFARRVVFDPFGNGYALGRSYHASPLTRFDVLLLSWDASGAQRFAREIDGATNFFDAGTDLVTDAAGNVYLTGFVDSTLTAFGSMLVAKVDTNGNVLWTRTFVGTLGAQGRSIALDAAGNVFACGATGAGTEALTVKLDSSGNTLWTRIYSVGVGTGVSALAVDASGGVVVVGSQAPSTPDTQDALVIAYDSAGNLRWTRTWDPPVAQPFTALHVAIGPAATIEVAAYGPNLGLTNYAFAFLRYDADGALRGSLFRPLTGSGLTSFAAASESGDAVFAGSEYVGATGANNAHVFVLRDSWSLGCPGDGNGEACPCSNAIATAHGCPNSAFASGALLRASGFPTVAADTFRLVAESMTGASCVFFQGSATIAPVIVDDGLGCIGGSVVRLGTKSVASNASAYPAPGDTSISVRGAIPPAGATRHYQAFYRNAAAVFCPPATSNRTNSVSVEWAP